MKPIKHVGVVGAGTMGSALAQKFAQEGLRVTLADRELAYVLKGLEGIRRVLNEGVEKNIFTPEEVSQFLSNIKGTEQLSDLASCDLIVEAIYEDFQAKTQLFKTLSDIVPGSTVLATNTSSFSVTELSASVTKPERFIGMHYFYHAAKNRLVEIIPGEKTSSETKEAMMRFSMMTGKDPILTLDAYGFAVNRFFVPWLNESVRLLQEGTGTIEIIDEVCKRTFGIGMGPFALMNATGVPIALHAQRTLEFFGKAYQVAELLKEQAGKKENWPITDTAIELINADLEKKIRERMLGCVFFVSSQILDEKICRAADLNRGAKIGLKWKKGPVDLMTHYGETEVKRLVGDYCSLYQEKAPAVSAGRWRMDYVTLRKTGNNAIITIDKPEDLNALNEEVVRQLDDRFSRAEADPAVSTIFITGSGKAFVAGADIKFFIDNIKDKTLGRIVEFTSYGQNVFEKIDRSGKLVVAALNGMALGGGLELALCADIIVASPKAILAFPETGIGIYPGLGGTQRTAARIGKGLAKYLILTGRTISAYDAAEIGLIDHVVGLEELFAMLEGETEVRKSKKTALSPRWSAYAELYSKNRYEDIINGIYSNGNIKSEEVSRLGIIMGRKAPVAMRIAEELIEAAKGPQSELEKLVAVFSTSDALKGLSSIGKKVEFEGK
ncbi:MAG: 3-hydroxyacyl-CoA dehydrogenase/enoyl-CoA hydratase family protein [Bacteroidota bacterium]